MSVELESAVALARVGRWKRYADRPNLVRALVVADHCYYHLFDVGQQTGPRRDRYPHKLALGTAGMPNPAEMRTSGWRRRQISATEYVNALRAAGVPFIWSLKNRGRIEVLDGRAATEEEMRRALSAYEYADALERERLEARMAALDAELGAAAG